MMSKSTSNLYDVKPAKTQTPNGPLPNGPPRMDRPERIPWIYGQSLTSQRTEMSLITLPS